MTDPNGNRSDTFLFLFFALFTFTSVHSIALAQISLGLALVTFIFIAVKRRYQPFTVELKWFYFFAGAYVLWLILTALINDTPVKSIMNIREEWLFLTVPVGIYLFREKEYGRKLVMVLAAGVALLSLYGVVQYLTGANWFRSTELIEAPSFGYRVQGYFSTRLTFANYFGTAAMFLLGYAVVEGKLMSPRLRRMLMLVSALAVVATVLTFSRGVVLAFVVVLVLMAFLSGRRYRLPIGGLVLVIIAVVFLVPGISGRLIDATGRDFNPEYEGGRIFIWKNSLNIIENHPLFGVGQGNFYEEYKALLPEDAPEYRQLTHAHNDFLNVAAVSGIPGMLFFVAMWISVFVYLRRSWRQADNPEWRRRLLLGAILGSTMFLLTSLIEATFVDEEVRQLLMIIWAAGLSASYKEKPKVIGFGD